MDKLVTAKWLNENLDQPDIIILYCSLDMNQVNDGKIEYLIGRESYGKAHILNARFVDLTSVFSDVRNPFMFTLSNPESFCVEMRELGISNSSRVVLDDRSFIA